jgi:hypothetical protein
MTPAQNRCHDSRVGREPMVGHRDCREAGGRVREARAETRVRPAPIVVGPKGSRSLMDGCPQSSVCIEDSPTCWRRIALRIGAGV